MVKYMINLIKCHFNYLINKATIFIIIIVFLISLFSNLISITSINSELSYVENNKIYFFNSLLIIKILASFLSVFIFSYSFLPKSDQYVFLIVTADISRLKYLLTKILAISIFLGLFIWIQMVMYILVGFIGYHMFIFDINIFTAFINLFLLIIYFGGLGCLLVQVIDNIYTVIIPISLMNIGTIINEEKINVLYKIYNLLFINFKNETWSFVYGYFHTVFILLIIFVINIIIYQYKDLN